MGERMKEASDTLLLLELASFPPCGIRELVSSKEFSALSDELKMIRTILMEAHGEDLGDDVLRKFRNVVYDLEDVLEKMLILPTLSCRCHPLVPFLWHLALYKDLNVIHKVLRTIWIVMRDNSAFMNGEFEKGVSSISSLTFPAQLLFLYLSLFPADEEIQVKKLLRLWVAEGFVETWLLRLWVAEGSVEEIADRTTEEIAETYFKELISRCMIDPVRIDEIGNVKSCKFNDPWLRTCALRIIENENFRGFYTYGCGNFKQNLRRLSIFGNTENMPPDKSDLINIRCFTVSGIETISSSLMDLLSSGLQLLRVLDLAGVHIEILPSELGNLIHLRYLGLRRTHIIKLPASLSRLRHLQTLDIRDTQVNSLPGCVIGLMELIHIHLVGACRTKVVELPLETGNLIAPRIQTLAGVRGTTKLVQKLQMWTQLRKLSIGRVLGDDSENLCASINKLSFLQSLSIKCNVDQTLQMETLLCSNNLKTLRIGSPVKPFAHLIHCFPYLCRLYLWDNMSEEDPFSSLQHLRNLMVLYLRNAYIGKEMKCYAGGFPKLKNLIIVYMESLECGTIELGGMQELERLFTGHCPNLKKPFQGLLELPVLHILKVSEMADEFVKVLEEDVKDGHFKVQNISIVVDV